MVPIVTLFLKIVTFVPLSGLKLINDKMLFRTVNNRFARFFAVGLVALVVFTGCDWVKSKLGMATSEDIARMKLELEQKMAREQRMKDSLEMVRLDSIKLAQQAQDMPYAKLDKQFYVVLGSFKKDFNAQNMVKALEKAGYSPVRIALKNGFDMVAAVGCTTIQEAWAEIKKIEENDLCPYDVWVYNVGQGLHVQ